MPQGRKNETMKRMLGFLLGAAVLLATAPSQAQDEDDRARLRL
jgi:hypothetical protein